MIKTAPLFARMQRCALTFGLMFLCMVLTGMTVNAGPLARTVRMIKPGIVGVGTFEAIRRPPVELRGTGFVILDGLYVITNYHVIPKGLDAAQKERLVIITSQSSQYGDRDAEIVALDPAHDLALLKMSGKPLQALPLGSGALLPEGTDVAITGFPIGNILGIYPVTHHGIIAAITPVRIPQADSRLLDVNMIMREPFDVYQLDMTAFPGNSGSPVYDVETGKIEAILNSTFIKKTKERALADPTGISFAIPVIYVHMLLEKAGLKK